MDLAKRLSGGDRFYYGWVIVGVAFISLGMWFGLRTSFSVFYNALLDEFAWSRSEAAGVQSAAMIVYTLLAPAVGGLIDRFGSRRVIVPGVGILFVGLTLCATIESLSQFYVFYGVVVGAGVTSIAIISYTAILARWFKKKRDAASGLAVSGMGMGIFVLVPLSQYLVGSAGWRWAFVALGGVVLLVLLPLNALLLRHKPEDLGLRPDGAARHDPAPLKTSRGKAEWTLHRAAATVRFWGFLACPSLAMVGVYFVVVHGVRFLVDQGVAPLKASICFAAMGLFSSAGRVMWGWLSDRIGREVSYTLGSFCLCLGFVSLMLLEKTGGAWLVYVFIIAFGGGWAVTAPVVMATGMDLFGGPSFGLIYGLMESAVGVGSASGAWLAGFIFDQTGSYEGAFILALAATGLSCLGMWLAAPRRA